ncbi:undecaprenyl/decaprenyl-phosphate alpha-N-acetylglucosaminyl 1-phosphate transferase [Candidatus Gottesmanbacteria bacterium]|nr:undecaprenyl/decaprenyl-phosphate alpha-N-acetylglucosaminyl 1-phosphate transferase [Candidatus Gottesmanbacteria bacterium]
MAQFIGFLTIVALISTYVATFFVKKIAIHYNLVDDPAIRKHPAHIHKGIIPRAGGLALFIGILVPIVFFLPVDKTIIGIMLGALITVVMGLIDDWKDVNPYIRFIGNIASAVCVVGAGIGISFISNPFGGVIHLDSYVLLPDLFAILFIVWTMNVVGWSSGVDGQLPGFVAIACFVLGILSLRFVSEDISQWVVTALAFITMGSFLGFLPWNFYPQKIMPGYGGKTLAGFMLATLSILSGAKVGTMFLVLGLPMTDALFTIIRRLGKGKSPVWADRGHLHHRLLDYGWSIRKIAVFYWAITALLGIIALNVSSQNKVFILLTLVAVVGGIMLWLNKAQTEFTQSSEHTQRKPNPQSRQKV